MDSPEIAKGCVPLEKQGLSPAAAPSEPAENSAYLVTTDAVVTPEPAAAPEALAPSSQRHETNGLSSEPTPEPMQMVVAKQSEAREGDSSGDEEIQDEEDAEMEEEEADRDKRVFGEEKAQDKEALLSQDAALLAQSYSTAKEKNRKAQQRFRERRKSLVDSLKQRVDSLTSQIAESEKQISNLRKENEELRSECNRLKSSTSLSADWFVNIGRPITLAPRGGLGDGTLQGLDGSVGAAAVQQRLNTLNSQLGSAASSQSMLLSGMESQFSQPIQQKFMLSGHQAQGTAGGLFLPFQNNFQTPHPGMLNSGNLAQMQVQMQMQQLQGEQLSKDTLLLSTMSGADNSRGATLVGQSSLMAMNLDQASALTLPHGSTGLWNGVMPQEVNHQILPSMGVEGQGGWGGVLDHRRLE